MNSIELDKYIFNPEEPQKCKAYKLFLNIAKKNPFVCISSDFIAIDYEKEIISGEFNDEIWDKPENYDALTVLEKIKVYKKVLSEKDYYNYIDKMSIDAEKFTYAKLFQNFFDYKSEFFSFFIQKTSYNNTLLKNKLKFPYEYELNYEMEAQQFHTPKIMFENNDFKILSKSYELFDVASVLVTELKNKGIYDTYPIHKNLKPIFLQKADDIKILLRVLREDLNKAKNKKQENIEINNISSIEIENFFSIKRIELENLGDKQEIYIVGENGDGKTLFLQALAIGLKGINDGDIFELVKSNKELKIGIKDNQTNFYTQEEGGYKMLLAYGANRNAQCRIKEDEKGYLTLFNNSLDLKNPIEYLQYLDHSEKSAKQNIVSLTEAIELLKKLLQRDVEIEVSPEQVLFKEKGSLVSFSQLSAGYSGVITIMLDMLIRFSEVQTEVKDIKEFRGVVLIDEVELHLHPKWKYDFITKLREVFPCVQFFITTHSPTVVLGAAKDAVFYKIYKEDGEVCISNQLLNEGYTSNTLISSPLFELEHITSRGLENNKINSNDYISQQIHERIKQQITSMSSKEDIAKRIDEELAKL